MPLPSDVSAAVCVVTGGLGFIGSNLCHELHRRGARVRIVDALVEGHGGDRRNVEGLPVDIVVREIGDPRVAEVLEGADVIFNLAGQVSHTASMRDPLRDLHLNATTHAAFLEMVRAVCPEARVVHTSTRQIYGKPRYDPVDEDHPAAPMDVNGVSKLAGEQLHLVHHRAYGLAATCLRLTNVYGPRQRLDSDELGFLPVFIRRALQNETIRIFGDGQQRRDCVFVDDVVEVLIRATASEAVGHVFNVGHPTDQPLADIASSVVAACASRSAIELVPWPDDHRRIDIGSFHTDGTAIADVLGWRAATSLDEGLGATAVFYRGQPWYLSST